MHKKYDFVVGNRNLHIMFTDGTTKWKRVAAKKCKLQWTRGCIFFLPRSGTEYAMHLMDGYARLDFLTFQQ
jgi:hypothetical protein